MRNQRPPFVIRSDGTVTLAAGYSFTGPPPKASAMDLKMVAALDNMDLDHVLSRQPRDPEHLFCHRLQAAVLEDAVRVLKSGGSRSGSTREDWVYDVWWVRGVRASVPGFSLRDICESFGFPYYDVRAQLLKLAEAAPKPRVRKKPAKVVTLRSVA